MNTRQHREIFDRYYSYVYAIVYRVLRDCGTREDAEECAADVFAEVFRRLDTIRPESLKAYLGTAARHRAVDTAKRLRREEQHSAPLAEDAPSEEDIAASAEQSALADSLMQHIRALGEPDATILIWKYYYDCTAPEIARGLGMRPAAVRARCSRALRKLREQLGKENRYE